MKRLHVNIRVSDLNQSIDFYNSLFGAKPTVVKPDYAKWLLDDPSVNFAISTAVNGEKGIAHLGIQAENETELQQVYDNIEKAEGAVRPEGDTVCCYAKSHKSWIKDPQGVEWEAFYTYGESETYKAEETACCDDKCCS